MKTLLLAALILSGCAIFKETPPTVQPFPLDARYTEIQADPGRVVDERIKRQKELGDKRRALGGTLEETLCAFTDLIFKTVWLARDSSCDWPKNRRHEKCHIDAHDQGIEDECHDGRKF